jgi:LPS-assembly lipoprotein
MKLLARALLIAVVLALAGCGFKLRGEQTFPFESIYIPPNSLLLNELSRNVAAGTNAKVVTVATEPTEARFILLGELQEKVILALNTQGRVREFQLRYRVLFSVAGEKGFNFIPPSEIILTRDITFNDQVLAKENEEALLYRDMRSDAVQQIMRRIAASKPPSLDEE